MDKVTTLLIHNAILLSGKDFYACVLREEMLSFPRIPETIVRCRGHCPTRLQITERGWGACRGNLKGVG